MARNRSHSIAFTCQVVQEFVSDETLHGLARMLVARFYRVGRPREFLKSGAKRTSHARGAKGADDQPMLMSTMQLLRPLCAYPGHRGDAVGFSEADVGWADVSPGMCHKRALRQRGGPQLKRLTTTKHV